MLRRQSGSITPSSDESTKNVVIAGSGFVEGAGVKFGGEAGQLNSISDTTIAVLAPDSTVAGPVDVEVTNVDG